MGGKANPTAISHTCEGPNERNSMISRNEVKASKRGPTEKTNRFCSISENIDIAEVEKRLANMHTTDKSEKTIAGARLPEPRGSMCASIAAFGEHGRMSPKRPKVGF